MPEISISDAEWLVMRVVWRLGKATASEVIAELSPAEKWNHRTVRTLLARLVEKGALAAKEEGNRYLYRPSVTQQKCVRAAGRSFLNKVFAGDATELLIHFAEESQMSRDQIDELKRLLDGKNAGRKKS